MVYLERISVTMTKFHSNMKIIILANRKMAKDRMNFDFRNTCNFFLFQTKVLISIKFALTISDLVVKVFLAQKANAQLPTKKTKDRDNKLPCNQESQLQ